MPEPLSRKLCKDQAPGEVSHRPMRGFARCIEHYFAYENYRDTSRRQRKAGNQPDEYEIRPRRLLRGDMYITSADRTLVLESCVELVIALEDLAAVRTNRQTRRQITFEPSRQGIAPYERELLNRALDLVTCMKDALAAGALLQHDSTHALPTRSPEPPDAPNPAD